MSYALIRAEVKTVLEGVSGIGKVYNRYRRPQDIPNRDSQFILNGVFHTWFITRFNMAPSGPGEELGTDGLVQRNHIIHLIGFYEFDDANSSETTFQDLCDTIMDTFDSTTNIQLNNTGDQLNPAMLVEFATTPEIFNGVLCHRAEIELVVSEII